MQSRAQACSAGTALCVCVYVDATGWALYWLAEGGLHRHVYT